MNNKYADIYASSDFHNEGKTLSVHGNLTKEMEAKLYSDSYERLILEKGDWRPYGSLIASKSEQINKLTLSAIDVDLNSIEALVNLTQLSVNVCPNDLKYNSFQQLRQLYIYWYKKCHDSIYQLPKLEELKINNWIERDCQKLAAYTQLTDLDLVDARRLESLSGIGQLKNLKALSITASSKLTDLSELNQLPKLEYLTILSCNRAVFPENLAGLHSLKEMIINNKEKVPTFKFIQGCDQLEMLAIGGGIACLDDDFSFVENLPNLKAVHIRNSRIYKSNVKALFEKYQRENADYYLYTYEGWKSY